MNTVKLSALALAFLAVSTASAQNLKHWWSGSSGTTDFTDTTEAVRFDGRGNLYALYTINNGGNIDLRITKYSNKGAVIWSTPLDVGPFDFGESMAVDAAGNLIVAGFVGGNQLDQDLLIARFDALTGVPQTRRVDHPQGGIRRIAATDIAIDPSDGNLVLAGGMDVNDVRRPYIFKYNSTTLQEIWRSGVDGRPGNFTHVVPYGNRIYFGGVDGQHDSVILGYVPTTGGELTTFLPTVPSQSREWMTKMIVMFDRVIWGATPPPTLLAPRTTGSTTGCTTFRG